MKLDEARAGIHDGQRALQRYSSPVSDMMQSTVDARQAEIEKLASRIDEVAKTP